MLDLLAAGGGVFMLCVALAVVVAIFGDDVRSRRAREVLKVLLKNGPRP